VSIKGNLSVDGNLSIDGNTLFVDATGDRVGIGTTSPNYLLQVASGTDGRSVNLSNVLYVNGTNGSVGIGFANPKSTLDVNGPIHINDNNERPETAFSIGSYTVPTTSEAASFMRLLSTLTLPAGHTNDAAFIDLDGGINVQEGTHTTISSLRVDEPNIQNPGTLTNAVTLYVRNTPTEGENNYALWVDDGISRLDGTLLVGTNTLVANATSGNVGIGTASPNYLLQVASGTDGRSVNLSGTLFVNSSSSSVGILTPGTSAINVNKNTMALTLQAGNSEDTAAVEIIGHSDSAGRPLGRLIFGNTAGANFNLSAIEGITDTAISTGALVFYAGSANNPAERMRITSAGNVGIGTTGPAATLHSNGTFIHSSVTNSTTAFQVKSKEGSTIFDVDTTNGRVGIGGTPETARFEVHKDGPGNLSMLRLGADTTVNHGDLNQIEFWSDGPLDGSNLERARIALETFGAGTNGGSLTFWTATGAGAVIEKMRIDKDGNIGIGTTVTPLTSIGAAKALTIESALGGYLEMSIKSDAVANGDDVSAIRFIAGSATQTFVAQVLAMASGTSENAAHLTFATKASSGSLTERMRITDSGNVGINTTSPAFTLDVTGNLRTTGTKTGFLGDIVKNDGDEPLEKGDLVSISFNGVDENMTGNNIPIFKAVKAKSKNDINIVGVVFEKSPESPKSNQSNGMTNKGEHAIIATHNSITFLKATNENGNILPGDYLTASSKAGYAMKADEDSVVLIGRALEPLNSPEGMISAFIQITTSNAISNINEERLLEEDDKDIEEIEKDYEIDLDGIKQEKSKQETKLDRIKKKLQLEGTLTTATNYMERINGSVIIKLG
ncbi:hypothetical protein HYT53_06305, partial [Candidatus Woesearchaeota archaeon]|nr:hypothetical protein [Candidatus Woesearchaeota archaeon]